VTVIKNRMRPVWHATAMVDRHTGRVLVVAETPCNLLVRLKGCRQALRLPWPLAYLRAATCEANSLRLEKINKRRSVRRGALIGGRQ
jgi:hypothetical protein